MIEFEQISPSVLKSQIGSYKIVYAMADWAYEQGIVLRWRAASGKNGMQVFFYFRAEDEATMFLLRWTGERLNNSN